MIMEDLGEGAGKEVLTLSPHLRMSAAPGALDK